MLLPLSTVLKKKELVTAIVFCAFVLLFLYLFSNINYFPVPDSDFFQYTADGEKLLQQPFAKIVTPPFYSVLMYLLEIILPIEYAGVRGGIFINICSCIVGLYFFWLFLRKEFGLSAVFPIILLVTNPLSYILCLQPSNLGFATSLLLIAMYFYQYSPRVAYMLGLLAFFTRVESAGMFIAFALYDIARTKKISNPRLFIFVIVVVMFSFVRPLVNTDKNDYYSEIFARKNEIPNVKFLRNSLVVFPFSKFTSQILVGDNSPHSLISTDTLIMLFVLLWISIGAIYAFLSKRYFYILLYVYCISYLIFHSVFPDSVFRYSYPSLPFIYALLFWPLLLLRRYSSIFLKRLIFLLILGGVVVIASGALTQGRTFVEYQRWIKGEKRAASMWLDTFAKSPINVYAFEYWMYQYYSTNKNVKYIDTVDMKSWTKKLCTLKDVYIVFDYTTTQKSYFDYNNGARFFQLMRNTADFSKNLLLIHKVDLFYRWAEIHRIDTSNKELCSNLSHAYNTKE